MVSNFLTKFVDKLDIDFQTVHVWNRELWNFIWRGVLIKLQCCFWISRRRKFASKIIIAVLCLILFYLPIKFIFLRHPIILKKDARWNELWEESIAIAYVAEMILKRKDALFLNASYCYDVKCRKCLYFLTFNLCHFILWMLQQMKMQFMMKHRCPKDVVRFLRFLEQEMYCFEHFKVLGFWYEQQNSLFIKNFLLG